MRTQSKTIVKRQSRSWLRTVTSLLRWLTLPFLLPLLLALSLQLTTPAATNLPEDFQSSLDAFQSQYGFPGATAAYVLPDGTVGRAATGYADVEAGTLMTVRSRMLAASIGKTFVGATTIALAQAGILDLDQPVSQWLGNRPWFSHLPNHDSITLRHLLTHSSGLPDHVHLDSFVAEVANRWHEPDHPFPPETLIQFVLDLPPLFPAGEGWAYSDTGYILIGLVIEQATGQPYYDQIQTRFLTPLGLTLTTPSNHRFLPGLVAGYLSPENSFGFPPKTTLSESELAWHPGFEWTGGGLVSNSSDLARWGAALFEGKALAGNYLDELLTSVSVSPNGNDTQYGVGVAIYRTGPYGPVYGHGGWIPGYSSSLRYYPDYGTTIAFQINSDVGIVDNTTPVIREMENRLAEIVISHIP